MKAPKKIIEKNYRKQKFCLWYENVDAVNLFILSSTQWRAGNNRLIGLDYNSIEKIAKIIAVKWNAQMLAKMQIMENELIKIINANINYE